MVSKGSAAKNPVFPQCIFFSCIMFEVDLMMACHISSLKEGKKQGEMPLAIHLQSHPTYKMNVARIKGGSEDE